MRSRSKKHLTVAASLACMLAGSVIAATPSTFKVSAKISHNGQALGAPTVVVKHGAPASVSISGENGFRLDLTVKDSENGAVEVDTRLNTNNGSVATTVVTQIGKPVVVASDTLDLELTVQPGGG